MPRVLARGERTVEVISAEHTSQIYLSPPSVPRDIVFFLITPIVRACGTFQTSLSCFCLQFQPWVLPIEAA